MTFSEQIVYGMFKPSKYKEILELKKSRWILYVIVLMMALCVASYVVPAAAFISSFGGFEKLFTRNVAPLEYTDGKLTIERPFEMSAGYSHILIDTDYATVPDEKFEKDGMYYALGSENIRVVYVINGVIKQEKVCNLNLLLVDGFDNTMMVEMIPGIYMFFVITFFILCLVNFITYGFFALVLSICVNSMNKRMEIGLSFGQVFMLCFYGQSFAMVLSNFNSALGLLPVVLVDMIGIFVSIHMITTAVLYMHKGNQV